MNARTRRIVKTAGLSLVELLVAVTVMSILTSISIKQYKDFRSKALLSAASVEAKNLANILILTAPANGGRILVSRDGSFLTHSWGGGAHFGGSSIDDLIQGYRKSQDIVLGIGIDLQGDVIVEADHCRLSGEYTDRLVRYSQNRGAEEDNVQTIGTQHPKTRC